VTLSEVADLIISTEAEFLVRGNYVNRRGVRGYFVQLKCANHWCKVSVSNAEHHSGRITIDELNELNGDTLIASAVIPARSLWRAFTSAIASNAVIHPYQNSGGVDGIWAEFHHDGSWYMVSVSHIDVPVNATHEELDRLADEFLLQQGRKRERRKFI
jgi:hypothetical protein